MIETLNSIALFIGWFLIIVSGGLSAICAILWVGFYMTNKAWKRWRDIHSWQVFREIVQYYRDNHDGKLPKRIGDIDD